MRKPLKGKRGRGRPGRPPLPDAGATVSGDAGGTGACVHASAAQGGLVIPRGARAARAACKGRCNQVRRGRGLARWSGWPRGSKRAVVLLATLMAVTATGAVALPRYAPNCAGAELTLERFVNADWVGVNFTGADLYGVTMIGSNLSDAILTGASLVHSNFTEAKLIGATLNGADLTWARLIGATLTGANLGGANLYEVVALEAIRLGLRRSAWR